MCIHCEIFLCVSVKTNIHISVLPCLIIFYFLHFGFISFELFFFFFTVTKTLHSFELVGIFVCLFCFVVEDMFMGSATCLIRV